MHATVPHPSPGTVKTQHASNNVTKLLIAHQYERECEWFVVNVCPLID